MSNDNTRFILLISIIVLLFTSAVYVYTGKELTGLYLLIMALFFFFAQNDLKD